MPRINKIRITGAKYDNFRKGYEDAIFDLSRNDEPDHTLFTLVNQGGKGVFMQLISQITMPDTRWGRESGNRIISMFYDRHRNFRPYTFHVAIEWKLDTVPEKWLVTGICVTAEKKFTSEDQDDRTGLNYFHYIIEHDGKSFFAVDNLPMYDKKNKKPSDYDEFERFINDNGKYIIKYPMSQTRRLNSPYYEYLKNRGIQRAEWEVMKVINRSEGGVSNYFSSAADNKSVIDRMIIPAITQNMNNYNENAGESLKEMFISNLSITRDLPRLLERENDYRELLVLLAPIIECADEGCETQKRLRKHMLEGNNILATLNNMGEKEYDKKAGWEEQLTSAKSELESYYFESDNLEYARYKKEQKEKKDRLNKAALDIEEYEKQLENRKGLKRDIETDILLKKRDVLVKERQGHFDTKQYLIKSMGLEDLKKEMNRIEGIITEKWKSDKEYFEEISLRHHSYQKHLKQINDRLDETKRSEDKRLRSIREEIAVFEDRKGRHKQVYNKLAEIFDIFSLSAGPEYLLAEIKEEAERRKTEIANLEASIRDGEEVLIKIRGEKYKKEADRINLHKDLEKEQSRFELGRENEEELKSRICQAENLDPVSVIYTHSWARSRMKNVESLIAGEKQRADSLKTRIWEINVDLEVNNKEYWIPNNDILSLKQEIASIGVGPVQTGTEFLYGIEDDELKKELIKTNPLLPYGVVIPSEKEWELINRNMDKSIFLRAAVPVFIRRDMKGTGIKSILNVGHRMAVDTAEYNKWYSRLGEESSATKKSVEAVEKRLDWLQNLRNDIINTTREPESNEILKKANDIKKKIAEVEKSISQLDVKIDKTNEKLEEGRKELDRHKTAENRDNDRITKLEAYVEEDNAIKGRQKDIDRKVLTEKELLKKVDEIEVEKQKNSEYIIQDEKEYARWVVKLNERLNSLKAVIPDVFVNYNIEGGTSDSPPEYNTDGTGNIFDDVSKRLELDREVEARNAEIRVLDGKIENLDEKIGENENRLDKTMSGWRERELSVKSEIQLNNMLDEITSEIAGIEKNLSENKIMSNQLTGELNQLESSISNVRRRLVDKYNRQAEQWEDADLDKKEFEIKRNIAGCKKRIGSINVFIREAEKKYNDIILSLIGLKKYEELEIGKGTVDESLCAKLEKETQKWVDMWQDGCRDFKRRLSNSERNMRILLDDFRNRIRSGIKEKILMEKLVTEIQNINLENFKGNLDAFTSMRNHFQKELETTSSDKKKAEQVREQWAQRAAKHIIRIIELMKEMVHGMVYINANDHAFPLIKLKGEEMMPSKEDEVLVLLKEHFIASINEVIKKDMQPEDIDSKMLDDLMGDRVLFSRALRGRYPVLMVYKMTEKNEFKYARPHDYYYASWEAVNRGEEGSAEGSGGQKLSICTFMMMMLVNFKKRSTGSKNPWTVLIMDNPFGQASAKHILDPIFEIADSLNFQIIAFAPPEIIKIDISKRFPVFWELRIEGSEESKIDVVTSRLVHGGRTVLV